MEYIHAFGRLLLITALASITISAPLFWGRQIALNSQRFADEPQAATFRFFLRADEEAGPAYSRSGFLSSRRILPQGVLTADLRPTRDQQWVVFGRSRLEDVSNGSGRIEDHSLAELSKIRLHNQESLLTLPEFLGLAHDGPLAFVLHSRETAGVKELLAELEILTDSRQIFLMSGSQALLRELRKARPDWRYGSDASTLAKIQLFSAVYLEPLVEIWADFIISPLHHDSLRSLSPRSIYEARRRKKPIFVETNGENPIPDDLAQNISGVLTARPRWAKDKFLP